MEMIRWFLSVAAVSLTYHHSLLMHPDPTHAHTTPSAKTSAKSLIHANCRLWMVAKGQASNLFR